MIYQVSIKRRAIKSSLDQFREAYIYVKNLRFDEEPDYQYITNLFLSILQLHQVTYNVVKPCAKRPVIVTPKEIHDLYE
jgi:hypothetical protein